jgi:UDP-N-acetylglucosamine 1-carboxyvinyltransferase
VSSLGGATHRVLADRVELGTYMIAPALAGGTVTLKGGTRSLVAALIEKLEEADIGVEDVPGGLKVSRRNGVIRPLHITTEPFPGFPTDLQAQIMAMLTLATGESVIEEHIFENRFMHVPELARMGAHIEVHGGTAHVHGVNALRGAPVMATDLRASVSLILAGLAAEGETVVSRVYHLDRGYEHVVTKLSGCGARIERIKEAVQ